MANQWLTHVQRVMKTHPGQKFTKMLRIAKKTYKKGGGGKKRRKRRKKTRRNKHKFSRRHRQK